jgi:phosphoribosylaminoimidazole-succinocarboxamide synthase
MNVASATDSRRREAPAPTHTEALRPHLERCLADIVLPALGSAQRGKVRDCFTIADTRVLVATDRISAFDVVFEEPIPLKGQVLNALAARALRAVEDLVPTHLLAVPDPNVMLAREAVPYPVEVIVRGYLTGSAWRDYTEGTFQEKYGFVLPVGLTCNARLATPIVTPTSKAATGHDVPLTAEAAAAAVGGEVAWAGIEAAALALYERGVELAAAQGLLLVDTKYEFGTIDGELTLIDEVHTPDSSRFWYADAYALDPASPRQLSKEFLREVLRERGFTGEGPVPRLDEELRLEVAARYLELYRQLTGEDLVPAAGGAPAARVAAALQACGVLPAGFVSIVMGSASDLPVAEKVQQALATYGVASRVRVASAHKVPERVFALCEEANRSAHPLVHITLAGRSNGLSGVMAANAVHPVIALPPFKDQADYMVNVHSSLQMPSETPSLTVVDPGNAALAAVRMLALANPALQGLVAAQIARTKAGFDA